MWRNVSVECEENEHIASMINLMLFNMSRTDSFLDLHKTLHNNPHQDDLLRASVVFTHATIEDSLRTIAAQYLPQASEVVLDKIPLLGGKRNKSQPYKFYLGSLSKFKEKTAETIIKKSVEEYLSQQTYNSSKDVNSLLVDMGLKKELFQKHYPLIDALCERRHQIVHKADSKVTNQGRKYNKITSEQVELWRGNALNFIAYLSFFIAWQEGFELVIANTSNSNEIKRTVFNPKTYKI